MIFPVKNGRITQKYWWGHRALDVAPKVRGDTNTTVIAPEAGKIKYKGYDFRNGHWISMQGKYGYHFFGHLARASSRRLNESVRQGDGLGKMGSTGFATGIHTHWVVYEPTRNSGSKIDPVKFLAKHKNSPPAVKPPVKPVYYRVKRGDTVYGICKRFGISTAGNYKAFKKLNPSIKNINLIYIGQRVRIR